MSKDSIKQAIQQLAGTHLVDKTHMAVAHVVSVDVNACTCTVQQVTGSTSAERKTVSLMPVVGDGWLLIPAIDSTVIIAWSDRNQPYVAMFSDLQDVYLDALGKITLNQGIEGGVPKVRDLVVRMNLIENAFNALNSKVNSLAPTPVIPPLVPTQVINIENPNVTHG
jgi:hypothetical protein